MAITLIRRTWLIFSLSSVFSTKDILESGDGIRPLASPILLTAYQMSVCSIASRLLPMSGLITVTPHQGHRYRRDPASLLISGAIICFNYAYVDLTNSFIQVARVAIRVAGRLLMSRLQFFLCFPCSGTLGGLKSSALLTP